MLNSLDIIIITSLFLVVYTYLFYPLVITILSKLVAIRQQNTAPADFVPSVAILCAMYNEEDVAENKIANFKSLTYPSLKMYIGSDGSSDKTNKILEKYSHDLFLSIYTFPRRGKVNVINDLIVASCEDILVFTDANSMFQYDAIEHLIEPFTDSTVGAVCGRLILLDVEGKSGEGFYWRFETMLKRSESVFKCVVGGNGAIYAVRRELVQQLPANTINDDFTVSMRIIQQGYGMIYSDRAIATEEVGKDDSVEFRRHVRDAAGHYRAMIHLLPLLNPMHPKRFFFYFSHRVIRWFVPHLMILLCIVPWFALPSFVAKCVLLAEGLFYLFAAIGCLSQSKHMLFYIPYYFTHINFALMIGFIRNLMGVQKVTWDRTQRV